MLYNEIPVSDLVGKVFTSVTNLDDEEIVFKGSDTYSMFHYQDCCEWVRIEEIAGDLEDLVGTLILVAEERVQEDPDADDSGTWTFYTFRTIKGTVDIRWYGSSNGYYSEGVSIVKV